MFSQSALTQKDHKKLIQEGQMYVFDRFSADFEKVLALLSEKSRLQSKSAY